MHLLKRSGSEY
jgi:hypothetical protein